MEDHNIQRFDYWIGEHEDQIENYGGVDLTKMSTLTVDRFYQILVGDPDRACFDLDHEAFLREYHK